MRSEPCRCSKRRAHSAGEYDYQRAKLSPLLAALIEEGRAMGPNEYQAALQYWSRLRGSDR